MTLNMAAYEPPDFYEFEVSPDLHGPTTAPSNASGIKSPISIIPVLKAVDDDQNPIEHLKTALMAAAVLSFIFLIAKDAHKAFTRRAHWIPCDFLVLSAFSIQMLNMLNTQNQAMATSSQLGHWLSIKTDTAGNAGQYARWKDFLMIHNSRTILCVFTAYVMPSMADRGLEHSWVRWAALVITVFHHVTSEFYSVKDNPKDSNNSGTPTVLRIWPDPSGKRDPVYYVFATTISLCFIFLILFLACATVAGRSIERIVAQQIPLVLRGEGELCGTAEKTDEEEVHHPHHPPHHHSCWRNVKIDVNRADQHYHLHRVHNHSCLQTVEEAVVRAGKTGEDESHDHHSCWRTVEDAMLRVEKEEEGTSHHSCWGTVKEAAARGEKEEEEQYRRHCHYCWRRVEDAVLKAWIIVRAYSVQPVLARSALTAASAVIVTIQIVITIVGGLAKVLKKENKGQKDTFKLVALVVQSIFILMAWALVNLRWAVAVAYHRKPKKDSWRSGLKMEDFWTRHLRELQQGEESNLEEAKSLDKAIDQLVSKKKTSTVPSIVLSAVIGLQWLLVSFSKACWLVSLMIFHNKWMLWLFNFFFEKHILCVFENYPKYKKILEEVQMLGESPESLWVSNRKSIEQAKRLSVQGNQDGECNCEDLVEFLINKRTHKGLGLSCLDPHRPRADFKFLCKKKPTPWITHQPQDKSGVERQQSQGRGKDPGLVVEEQFSDDSKKSLKMAAVSLLGIIVHLSTFNVSADDKEECSTSAGVDKEECSFWDAFPPKDVKNCLEVYSQAWEIVDFVEEAEEDTKADRVTSEAADKYFRALQKVMDKTAFSQNSSRHATPEDVRVALEDLKKKATELQHLDPLKKGKKQGVPNRCEGNDSIDWKAAASGRAVYNLCDSIVCNEGADVNELRKEIERCLADIINECLQKTQKLLLVKLRKWALKRDEKRLGKALYTTGKAKAIMEKLACNKLAIVSYH